MSADEPINRQNLDLTAREIPIQRHRIADKSRYRRRRVKTLTDDYPRRLADKFLRRKIVGIG